VTTDKLLWQDSYKGVDGTLTLPILHLVIIILNTRSIIINKQFSLFKYFFGKERSPSSKIYNNFFPKPKL